MHSELYLRFRDDVAIERIVAGMPAPANGAAVLAGLKLEVPTSGSHFGAPRPDIVVSNPRTGALLLCRMKSGLPARYIPLSTLAYLRGLRDWFLTDRGIDGGVVFISTGPIPELVKKGSSQDGIPFFEVASPEEATERLTAQLPRLQQAA